MKITVVCLASRSGGGLTILQDLFNYASQVDNDNVWQFLLSDQVLGPSSSRIEIVNTTPRYQGWRSRIWAELNTGRRAAKEFSPDFVLSLQNVDTPVRGNRPLILYVQQALPFQKDYKLSFFKPEERKLAWRQYLLKWPILMSVKRSSTTFVQTRWLAERINEMMPDSQVVPIGHSQELSKEGLLKVTREPSCFFYPASGASYKNHKTLHFALRLLHKEGIDLENRVSVTLTKEQLIKAIGVITDQELQWYRPLGWLTQEEVVREYAKSILVFPSLVESLGLPLYEARSLGIPIVAGKTEFGKEALAGYSAVKWFAATEPESMAQAMKKSLESTKTLSPDSRISLHTQNPWALMLSELRTILGDSS